MVAIKHLLKNKSLSAISVLGLAVGMAGFILIVLYVQYELSYDRHHVNSDRIFRLAVTETIDDVAIDWATTSGAWAPALARDNPGIEGFTRLSQWDLHVQVRYGERSFNEKNFVFVDSTVFDVFTIPLLQGSEVTALSGPNSVVLSESMVSKYFADEDPIGKTISVETATQTEYEVTGVMQDIPENSHLEVDFLASTYYGEPAVLYIGEQTDYPRYNFSFLRHQNKSYTYFLLKDESVAEELENQFPMFIDKYLRDLLELMENEYRPFLQPLTDIHLKSSLDSEFKVNGDIKDIYIFSVIAGVILLISCVNAMGLSITWFGGRMQENGVRKRFNTEQLRLVTKSTGESVFLSLIALMLALGLVYLVLPQFNQLSGKELEMDFKSSWLLPVLAVTALGVSVAVGAIPACIILFIRRVRLLIEAHKSNSPDPGKRRTLIILQIAASIFVVVGVAVASAQLAYVQNKQLGFDPENVVIISMKEDWDFVKGFPSYKNAVLQYPEVLNAGGTIDEIPGMRVGHSEIKPEGVTADQRWVAQMIVADLDFIETLGIKPAAGYAFSKAETTDPTEYLINETAARTWGWENPLNMTVTYIIKTMTRGPPETIHNVIGVISDFHNQSPYQPVEPLIINLYNKESRFAAIKLDSKAPERGLEILQNEWQKMYPDKTAMDYYHLEQALDQMYIAETRMISFANAGALLSIFIALLGLSGVVYHLTRQRTRKFSIRELLDATITKLILLAFLIGAPAGYLIMLAWLRSFDYYIELNLLVFVFAGFAALLVTWLTVGYHALKSR